jgi:hypothetical protein
MLKRWIVELCDCQGLQVANLIVEGPGSEGRRRKDGKN